LLVRWGQGDSAALELLTPLTKVPSWISPDELRSDPTWAALRSHPLFPQLAH